MPVSPTLPENDPVQTPEAECRPNDATLIAWQIEQIEMGIAAADRGDFATSEEVEAVRLRARAGRQA